MDGNGHSCPPAALSIADSRAYTGLGQTTLYKAIREGKLQARKCGRRTLILRASLDTMLAGLPEKPSLGEPMKAALGFKR